MTLRARRPLRRAFAALTCCVSLAAFAASTTIYKWTDASGTLHLSSTKPPAGVKYETVTVHSAPSSGTGASHPSGTGKGGSAVSSATAAQRADVIASLRNRECVIALEALDRLTSGARPTTPDEIARLKQTVDQNCSRDPAQRREQEDMAAKLRVANGPECVKARSELAAMAAPASKSPPEQVRAQQAFVDEHCIPPVQ